jgi:hypothetical protein
MRMKCTLAGMLCVFAAVAIVAQTDSVKDAVGTWEGESKCTVPDSPCKDEHVIYEITADGKEPGRVKMDGYKVVNGEKQFMGTLTCDYQQSAKTMRCSPNARMKAEWEYHISGDAMGGTLVVGEEKKLYRKVSAKRKG